MNQSNIATVAVAVFGLFSLIGGFIGYTKAGSRASLIAGSLSGIVLLLCAYGIWKGNTYAAVASLLVAVLLGGRFLVTWIKNRRVMPDLLMVLLSLTTLLAVAIRLMGR